MTNGRRIRFVLLDKRPGHVRKILLFRPAVGEEEIMIPWTHYSFQKESNSCKERLRLWIAGKQIQYKDAQGDEAWVRYDLLVVAVGASCGALILIGEAFL